MKKKRTNQGYIATMTVLVVMVAILSITTTVALLGIGEAQGGIALTRGEQTLTLTESCTEDALLRIRNNPTYAGGTVNLPEGSCSVTIDSKIGNDWVITVRNTGTDYVRSVRTEFTRLGGINMTSWREI